MLAFTALYDACVRYPAPLRDFLLRLASTEICDARWTGRIHEEWWNALLKVRKNLDRATLERTRDLMNRSLPNCLVTDYESLIKGLALPDAGDRHVVAAAIRARADIIVTFNLVDFPNSYLAQFGI